MSIALQTTGVHHLTLRSTDLTRAHAFYGGTLGFPIVLEASGWFAALAGDTVVVVRGPEPQTPVGDRFNPLRVGLDHIALACKSDDELERVARALKAANVPTTDIRVDPALRRRYVAFKDPDGIAWEFYMSPDVTPDGNGSN